MTSCILPQPATIKPTLTNVGNCIASEASRRTLVRYSYPAPRWRVAAPFILRWHYIKRVTRLAQRVIPTASLEIQTFLPRWTALEQKRNIDHKQQM
ncbi:hypothetical protein E2542_SST00638 [Spatholobus suberectus]|nr:hypothetical protein E2542_SST00638 [Spatholobus suberectus]